MSESSPEKQPEADAPKADNKVPVEALAKERAEKRAARSEADEAKKELAKLKEQTPDPDVLLDAFNNAKQAIKAEAQAAVEQQLAPYKLEAAKWKAAVALGLSEQQADVVMAVRAKYPEMPDQQALAIARMDKPELFQKPSSPSFNPTVHGGFPAGGDSPFRTAPNVPNFRADMHKARKDGDQEGAHGFAEKAFIQQINMLRPQS